MRRESPVAVSDVEDPSGVLLELLSSPALASRRPVFERYDHQVMTNTVVRPGEGDAAVLRVPGTPVGIALSTDCNTRYTDLDPFEGARHAVAEAARNVACTGARPLAITNNLNFGNPTEADVYHQLERSVEGLREACLALDTPVTGGNVSLYNQYREEDGTVAAVPPTPTVGMIGVLEDVSRHATMAIKRAGDELLVLGRLAGELGASEYLATIHGLEAGRPPRLDLELERRLQDLLVRLIAAGLCDTAHDTAEGGLAVALAEMALAGQLGIDAELPREGRRLDELLFGESASRVVLGVRPEQLDKVLAHARGAAVTVWRIGTAGGDTLRISAGDEGLELSLAELARNNEAPLKGALS